MNGAADAARRRIAALRSSPSCWPSLIVPGAGSGSRRVRHVQADRDPRVLAHGSPDTTRPARIDKITHDANGGSIEFTDRSQDTSGDCVGKDQHFKFSWKFSKDVSTLSGKAGDNLFVMSTKWEGDAGTKCLDENPWVWIRSGGSWGTNPGEGVNDNTFQMDVRQPRRREPGLLRRIRGPATRPSS